MTQGNGASVNDPRALDSAVHRYQLCFFLRSRDGTEAGAVSVQAVQLVRPLSDADTIVRCPALSEEPGPNAAPGYDFNAAAANAAVAFDFNAAGSALKTKLPSGGAAALQSVHPQASPSISAKEREIEESKALITQLRQAAAAKDAAQQAVEATIAAGAEAAKHAALDAEATPLRAEVAALLQTDSPGASYLPCHTPKTRPATFQLFESSSIGLPWFVVLAFPHSQS
jgi:hypothetical protein